MAFVSRQSVKLIHMVLIMVVVPFLLMQPFNNAQALKMHNPENWIVYKPFKQAAIVQRLLKLSENFKDHCTHH